MKKIREYKVRIPDEEVPSSVQKALYKPTPDELALLKRAACWDSDEILESSFDRACRTMTGLRDNDAWAGGRYEYYAFHLTESGLLSVTCWAGLNY